MLAGDYLTFERKAKRSGGSPLCRNCEETPPKNENLKHILIECNLYIKIRERIFLEFENACKQTKSKVEFEDIRKNETSLTQFILDPSSFNLEKRVHINDPALSTLFRISRDYCYAVNSMRMKKLSTKENWIFWRQQITSWRLPNIARSEWSKCT